MTAGYSGFFVRLAKSPALRAVVPEGLRSRARALVYGTEYQQAQCLEVAERLYGGPIPAVSDYPARYDWKVAVVRDQMSYYVYNVRACRDLGVPYELVDLAAEDWLDQARRVDARAFLVWPAINHSVWKQIYDERLRALVECDGARLVPHLDELWLQDSKRRVTYWLAARGVPAPRTWIFYDQSEALEFLSNATFPLVFKTDTGAASRGVAIFRHGTEARTVVRRVFGRGVRARGANANDRQVGNVLFQEFVPHDHEWRVMRVGDDFLCRRKSRVGEFASGSGAIGWAWPPEGLLDFVRELTDRGGLEHMSVDVFEASAGDRRGRFLVNELQCVVGAIAAENNVNEATGRWRRDERGAWVFEPGYFYQNACANLRLEWLLEREGRHPARG